MTSKILSFSCLVLLSVNAWSACECKVTGDQKGTVALVANSGSGERTISSFPFGNITEKRNALRQCEAYRRTSASCTRDVEE